MERSIYSMMAEIVGDVPVSVQLNTALSDMAKKDHEHEEYVSRIEFDELKKIVDRLIKLVGDESVSSQINNAIQNVK